MAGDLHPEKADEALIGEYLRDRNGPGGRRAADALVARWSERVYRWAWRVVRDREQALDLAQDSLLQMFEGLPAYQPRGRFSAWLFVIVHNRCVSAVRRRSFNVDPDVDADQLWVEGGGPADEMESEERRRRVFAAMDAVLESHERAALWLRAYEGMSVDDITRVLRLDGATGARGVLQTARRKLRAALAEPGEPRGERT